MRTAQHLQNRLMPGGEVDSCKTLVSYFLVMRLTVLHKSEILIQDCFKCAVSGGSASVSVVN